MTTIKLNVLLAKTDHLAASFKRTIQDFSQFFSGKQSHFKGEKKTYDAKPGSIDLPNERSNKLVVTTVIEKLDWRLKETNKDYINALMAQEATNASGIAKAELVVDGKSFGTFSSLELLRIKSLLENGELEQMYAAIPVRNDDELWVLSTDEMYKGKQIFESVKQSGIKKSVTKESYILPDPNIDSLKDSSSYKPQVAQKDTIIDLGDYSYQKFSGEWSHRERKENSYILIYLLYNFA